MSDHPARSRRNARGDAGLPTDAIPDVFRVTEALCVRSWRLDAFWPEVPKQKRGEPVVVRTAVASTFAAALEMCWGRSSGGSGAGFWCDHGLPARDRDTLDAIAHQWSKGGPNRQLASDVELTAIWQYMSCQEAEEMSSLSPPIRPAVDPGPPPIAPNLADPTTRLRLTPAAIDGILKLAEIWRLTSAEACALLGDISERSWFRMKKGERASGSLSQDTLTRMSALIGIFKGLRLLFSEPLSHEWIRLPNKGPLYAGRRPLDALIKGGIPKMLEVRRHIDALRGGL